MRYVLGVLAILIPSAAWAQDYQCMSSCSAQGYTYRQCSSACSDGGGLTAQPGDTFMDTDSGLLPNNESNPGAVTDYQCVAECQSDGGNYRRCVEQCSY
jgi:hypothetical protein